MSESGKNVKIKALKQEKERLGKALKKKLDYVKLWTWNNRVAGWLASILHRMGVVLMNKNHFDFKDLMAFGMFILALLTFIFVNLK